MASLPVKPPGGTSPTVLVVDDDQAIVTLCQRVLEQAGFSVLSALGSSEALKICRHHEGLIDLLVTDLILPPPDFSFASTENEFPHVNGNDLALRALTMRKNLRVIIMSGNVDQELVGQGIKKGMLPLLSKPFDAHTLVSLVNQTMQTPSPTTESMLKGNTPGVKGADEWFD